MTLSTERRQHDTRPAQYKADRIIVIYERPADYPTKFVARVWELTTRPPHHQPEWLPTPERALADTLEDIRRFAAPGRGLFPRLPGDDACIVECWI